jgi:hypothetical protein
LDQLEPILSVLRGYEALQEKSRGTFYRRSKAFVHFHEDPAGLFADVRLDPTGSLERWRVTTGAEVQAFLEAVRLTLRP